MHKISEIQNQPVQIQRLRAQRRLYDEVRRRKWLRLGGVLLLTIIWVAFGTFVVKSDLVLVAGSGLITIMNFFSVRHWQEAIQHKAVLVQELFDCDVLNMKWNNNVHDPPPAADFVVFWSDKYDEKKYEKAPLTDWYSDKVDLIPLEYGRLCCQFSNLDWDKSLRTKYISMFVFAGLGLTGMIALLVWLIGIQEVNKYWFSFAFFLPLAAILWQETERNVESIKNLKTIRKQMESKWADVITGELPMSELEMAARDWQFQIFEHRMVSPVLPGYLYMQTRPERERIMNRSSGALAEQVLAILGKKTK